MSVNMYMCICSFSSGSMCLYVLSDLPVLCICLNLVYECTSTYHYLCLCLYVVFGGQAYVGKCMFHHFEQSNKLIFAACLHRLPPVHLQGLLRLLSNNGDSVISWPCAQKLASRPNLCGRKQTLQFSPTPVVVIDNFTPLRVSKQQAASLRIRILPAAQQATTHH